MKRLIFCFDGTWNRIDGENPTNVVRLAQSIAHSDRAGHAQIIYYDEGVGTSAREKLRGGIFGLGLSARILRAYRILVLNYEAGDEIFVFGFSRGAFSARSFVGLLRNAGIMSRRSLSFIREAVALYMSRADDANPNSDSTREFRYRHCPELCLPGDRQWRKIARPADDRPATDLRVSYLGVWDTVGALGVPSRFGSLSWINRRYGFHDTRLSSVVERARHAVSIDERRRTFEPALWTNLDDLNADRDDRPYQQMLFPGVHAAVGGGGPIRGLSDIALEWILEGARAQGLAIDSDPQSPLFALHPDHRAQLFNAAGKTGWTMMDRVVGTGLRDRSFIGIDRQSLHQAVARRFHEDPSKLPEGRPYRPASLRGFFTALGEEQERVRAELANLRARIQGAGDERALRAPSAVRDYVVQPGDTLERIAEREMGRVGDREILLLHNRNVGCLFDEDHLYAGDRLEIPIYDGATN